MNLHGLALEYFTTCKLMQLATISDGNPWICNVYFVIDDDLNIYWTSAKGRQHSVEIMANPKVAVSIVKVFVSVIVGGPIFLQHPEYAARVGADGTAQDGRNAVLLLRDVVVNR